MNILTKNLNIFGTETFAVGSKCTKKEARMNGFEAGKSDVYVAVIQYNGQSFTAYGYDFEDAVSTACKDIRFKPLMKIA